MTSNQGGSSLARTRHAGFGHCWCFVACAALVVRLDLAATSCHGARARDADPRVARQGIIPQSAPGAKLGAAQLLITADQLAMCSHGA